MAPDAEDCEVERLNGDCERVVVHQNRRILPEEPPLAQAWTENEEDKIDSRTNSPGENRRLLGPKPLENKSRLQAGLTLGVWSAQKKYGKSPQPKTGFTVKTKFQKRKEKLIDVLRPPYFIVTIIIVIVMVYLCMPKDWHAWLVWTPDSWWRQPWRLFTYGCVHASPEHLALNAIVALAVGWRLEREQGWVRVAGIWCGGLAAGALGEGALQPQVRVVGASAAVYALLTAHLPNVLLRFGHIPLWWFRPLSVIVLGASEACWAHIREPDSAQDHVAWGAHAFGAAVGIPLGLLLFTGENSSKRYILVGRVISGLLIVAGWCTVTYQFYLNADRFT